MPHLSFLLGKHHDPQSISGKLFPPIISIGIVVRFNPFVGQPLSKQLYTRLCMRRVFRFDPFSVHIKLIMYQIP